MREGGGIDGGRRGREVGEKERRDRVGEMLNGKPTAVTRV